MKRLGLAAALLVLATVPFWVGNTYYINIASQILLYAVFALGLNVLVGYAGLVSLGHAGLFGIAAYAGALLINSGYVDDFADYCTKAKPVLSAENGREVDSYIDLRKIDGVNPVDYVGKLSPIAYETQGYTYNRAMFNSTTTRLGQAIAGEMSLDDALKRMQADIDEQVKAAAK